MFFPLPLGELGGFAPNPSASAEAAEDMVIVLQEETTNSDIRVRVGLSRQSASLGMTLAG